MNHIQQHTQFTAFSQLTAENRISREQTAAAGLGLSIRRRILGEEVAFKIIDSLCQRWTSASSHPRLFPSRRNTSILKPWKFNDKQPSDKLVETFASLPYLRSNLLILSVLRAYDFPKCVVVCGVNLLCKHHNWVASIKQVSERKPYTSLKSFLVSEFDQILHESAAASSLFRQRGCCHPCMSVCGSVCLIVSKTTQTQQDPGLFLCIVSENN